MEAIHIALLIAAVCFWGMIITSAVRAYFAMPSDFAAGIARSLRADPRSWDYNSDENWLISEKAALEISLQAGNYGRVNTRNRPNSGTSKLDELRSTDLRAFRSAFREWQEKTAIERKATAERRKNEALTFMAA